MFEASSVYFQYVNELAAYVKIDRIPVCVDLGHSKSPISLVIRGSMNENQKALRVFPN